MQINKEVSHFIENNNSSHEHNILNKIGSMSADELGACAIAITNEKFASIIDSNISAEVAQVNAATNRNPLDQSATSNDSSDHFGETGSAKGKIPPSSTTQPV